MHSEYEDLFDNSPPRRKESMHSDPREEARDILRHYDMIASDVGEIYVDDLIDHWVGQGNPSPGPGVRAELIKLNYGNEYFR